MQNDERFMARALELAARAPFTSPNPKVGAVVVRDGEVISEGWHLGPGHPHAEAEALSGADARGATLYVTLEPCTQVGRTPACAPAIVDAGVARVVVAVEDPDARVRGRGVALLRTNDIEVTTGVLAAEVASFMRAYLHHRSTERPLVTLKLALSIDGRLGGRNPSERWLTGENARRLVHQRRAQVDAVMVGAGTVLMDDPSLTARTVEAHRQPVRIIVDAVGRVPPTATVFDSAAETIVATTHDSTHEIQTAWKETGAEVLVVPRDGSGVDLRSLLSALGRRGFLEVYCEGGAELATSLLRDRLVDRLELHRAPVIVGAGPVIGEVAADRRWTLADIARVDDDVITTYERKDS